MLPDMLLLSVSSRDADWRNEGLKRGLKLIWRVMDWSQSSKAGGPCLCKERMRTRFLSDMRRTNFDAFDSCYFTVRR